MDYLQQQPGLVLAELEQQPFVDDEERRLGVLLQRVFEGVPVFRGGQVHQQVGQPGEPYRVEPLAGLHPERAGQIRLAASGSARDEDVAALRYVLAAGEFLDQRLVQLASRVVVDRSDSRVVLLELGLLDEPFEGVALAAGVFGVHEHGEPLLEGDVLHFRVVLLVPEHLRHGRHAHLHQLVDCRADAHLSPP